MQRYTSAILACCALLLQGCKTEKEESAAPPDTSASTTSPAPQEPPAAPFIDDTAAFMERLIGLERAVRANPSDNMRIKKLLAAAFDTISGSFFTVGMGIPNPALPQAAATAGQRRAAEKDAQRWCLYLIRWHQGDTIPFGTRIDGVISYHKKLRHTVSDDTLYQLIMVPVGGISVDSGEAKGTA